MPHSTEFTELLRRQAAAYPQMQPRDWGKLAYQSEFGPEHMVGDRESVLARLHEELAAANGAARAPEPIGNGLCRFYLDECPDDAMPLLAELFCRTAAEHRGSRGGLEKRLRALEGLDVPGMGEWLARYRADGCPPLSHSETYRRAYAPHYRVLMQEYAEWFPTLLTLQRWAHGREHTVIAVDGRCGSGKTTLAALLARIFPCNVYHMDDFHLPRTRRSENWRSIPFGNMELDRFEREVLRPAAEGREVAFRPYDCPSGCYREVQVTPPKPLTVVEGSYALAPKLRPYYDHTIFLTCAGPEQTARLQEREGDYFPAFPSCWIPLEEAYYRRFGVEQLCDLTVDTTNLHTRITD